MDWFVANLNTLIQIGLITGGAFGFFYALKNEIAGLRSDVSHIQENQRSLAEAFAQLGSILTKVAVQDTRLNMLEKKIDELSHGQGFVKIN